MFFMHLIRHLNIKAIVGDFNQEKALVGAISVIVKTSPIGRLQLYNESIKLRVRCVPTLPTSVLTADVVPI